MVLRNIIPSVMAQIDFVKDLIQVALLTLAVGGPSYVLGNAYSFSSVVRKTTQKPFTYTISNFFYFLGHHLPLSFSIHSTSYCWNTTKTKTWHN